MYKSLLVQKPFHVLVKIKDGRPLVFGFVTHETISVEIELKDHKSYIVFKVLETLLNYVI